MQVTIGRPLFPSREEMVKKNRNKHREPRGQPQTNTLPKTANQFQKMGKFGKR